MLGIILCGGKSTRMGSDKGLIMHGENNWASIARQKLDILGIKTFISINQQQIFSYGDFFDHEAFIIDDSGINAGGAMVGILSSHLKNPEEDLFVLACDMPLMSHSVINAIFLAFKSKESCQAAVYSIADELEPMCAIYSSEGLKKIYQMLTYGNITKFSMRSILKELSIFSISVSDDQRIYFKNFNDRASLQN